MTSSKKLQISVVKKINIGLLKSNKCYKMHTDVAKPSKKLVFLHNN